MEKILDFAFIRTKYIENEIDELKCCYIKKTIDVKNNFNADFYCLCSEFAYVDAVSCFAEMDLLGNIFYENLCKMTDVSWKRFFKIYAMYSTIKICLKRKKDLKYENMKNDMYFIFDFEETEKKFFELLCKMAFSYEVKFNVIFPQIVIKYVLGKVDTNTLSTAFIDNFYYNSYKRLMKYFSQYISIARRIKLAKRA